MSVDARGWKRTRGGLPGAVRYVAIADHSSDSAHWPGARTRGCRIGDSALCTFRGWWRFMRSKQKASTQWHKRRAGIAKNSLPVPVKVDGKRTPGGAAGEPGHTLCRSPTPNLLQKQASKQASKQACLLASELQEQVPSTSTSRKSSVPASASCCLARTQVRNGADRCVYP